jgi:Ca2+-binding RTX toxin-like protein
MNTVYGTNAANVISWGLPPFLSGTSNAADLVYGLGGDDTIYGYGGSDTLLGGEGADHLDGGSGSDTASYTDSWQGVYVSLQLNSASGGTAQGDTFVSIENLTGSEYRDVLHGDAGSNILAGNGGDDILYGFGGDDILLGGAGGDWLFGGAGADRLDGGAGRDIARYEESPAAVAISLITDAAGGGDAEGDDLNSIEDVSGSQFNDTLIGDDGANTLLGMGGNDVVKGYGGADWLAGIDGDDWLDGMEGNDYIAGGLGRDVLVGGAGADRFDWNSTADTSVSAGTMDRIEDFNFAQGDRIDLGDIDANAYVAGNQAFNFIGTAAFSGTPGEINYYYSGGNTIIQLQTGVDADIEGGIVLKGLHTPDASWFVL